MIDKRSAKRFNHLAEHFLTSEVHRTSPTIGLLHRLLENDWMDSICDVACGAGHLGISFSGRAKYLVGVDPSERMLENFVKLANEKKIPSKAVQDYAENISLSDSSFDLVTSRLAAHHFYDIQLAVKEMARIAKKEGKVAIIDLEGYEDVELDETNHQLETIHDPTHVRSYTAKEWQGFFNKAGLKNVSVYRGLCEFPSGLATHRWCEIADSGAGANDRIKKVISQLPQTQLEEMNITERNGEFYLSINTLLIIGQK
ncbi:class I SAM-dependent methyltransferase [Mechercharimyces sp. CAU 1602]|uniref:class I SAM-dependent methyltransferase n=1 Tax=Mechercharimyces sp. CAU 1602 TaxID=2973933 RepID=UPI0021638566|nr:class I SAM-dependent methyltransferase [Mechercharimyces sp. CAU 1602]MCS1352619.1 methyltransferase domain-containing protein [Mechercharimyces sp. CAU 1602]